MDKKIHFFDTIRLKIVKIRIRCGRNSGYFYSPSTFFNISIYYYMLFGYILGYMDYLVNQKTDFSLK